MTMNIFIDESGNTGDIFIKKKKDFLFNGQSCFVLAAIAINEENDRKLVELVNKLRIKYRIPAGRELKSSELYKSKPYLLLELFKNLYEQKLPIFIEINDKKYFLCSQISTLLFTPILSEATISDSLLDVMRSSADFLYNELSDEIFFNFSKACRERTHVEFISFMENIEKWLLTTDGNFNINLLELYKVTINMYYETMKMTDSSELAVEYFLPESDLNLKGKTISSLPHITALATICARVQKYSVDMNIERICFIHDEQKHLGKLLFKNMQQLSQIDLDHINEENHLKERVLYHFSNDVQISFEESDEHLGIQIADLLAGAVYRFWVDYLTNSNKFREDFHKVFYEMCINNNHPSCGMNFVVPQADVDSFFQL